jgi:hypothetical protein
MREVSRTVGSNAIGKYNCMKLVAVSESRAWRRASGLSRAGLPSGFTFARLLRSPSVLGSHQPQQAYLPSLTQRGVFSSQLPNHLRLPRRARVWLRFPRSDRGRWEFTLRLMDARAGIQHAFLSHSNTLDRAIPCTSARTSDLVSRATHVVRSHVLSLRADTCTGHG